MRLFQSVHNLIKSAIKYIPDHHNGTRRDRYRDHYMIKRLLVARNGDFQSVNSFIQCANIL